jgi:hypothetical protein
MEPDSFEFIFRFIFNFNFRHFNSLYLEYCLFGSSTSSFCNFILFCFNVMIIDTVFDIMTWMTLFSTYGFNCPAKWIENTEDFPGNPPPTLKLDRSSSTNSERKDFSKDVFWCQKKRGKKYLMTCYL